MHSHKAMVRTLRVIYKPAKMRPQHILRNAEFLVRRDGLCLHLAEPIDMVVNSHPGYTDSVCHCLKVPTVVVEPLLEG